MNEPRPRITSARPFEAALSVEKRWNTRIGSSEDSTVTAEPRWMRLVRAGDRRQHDFGRGYGEVRPVMLAKPDEVDADLVGEHRLLDHVADDLGVRQRLAVGSRRDVAESIESEFENLRHSQPFTVYPRPIRDNLRLD